MDELSRVITDRMSVVVIANNRTPTHQSGCELNEEGRRRIVRESADAQLGELVKAFPTLECRVLFDGIPVAGSVPHGR